MSILNNNEKEKKREQLQNHVASLKE